MAILALSTLTRCSMDGRGSVHCRPWVPAQLPAGASNVPNKQSHTLSAGMAWKSLDAQGPILLTPMDSSTTSRTLLFPCNQVLTQETKMQYSMFYYYYYYYSMTQWPSSLTEPCTRTLSDNHFRPGPGHR